MRFLIFSDDDTFHHPLGFSSFLSMFDHRKAYHFAPTIREPKHDCRLSDFMYEVDLCQRQDSPQCVGVPRECRMDGHYWKLKYKNESLPPCGDIGCETCLAHIANRTRSQNQYCHHPDLAYSCVSQPFVATAPAVEKAIKVLAGPDGLTAQCRALGLTHDKALGLLMWVLQIPSISHFSTCAKNNRQSYTGVVPISVHGAGDTASSMQKAHDEFQQLYGRSGGDDGQDPAAATAAAEKHLQALFKDCFSRTPHLLNEKGMVLRGGIAATKYWQRTTAEQRSGSDLTYVPFRFDDCADYTGVGNEVNWTRRVADPRLPEHRAP